MCCNNTVSHAWGCGCTGSTPTTTATTTMTARVLEVRCDSPAGVRLLHLPAGTGEHRQRLLLSGGDCLCIHYNGAMTSSIPPQISATCIHRR